MWIIALPKKRSGRIHGVRIEVVETEGDQNQPVCSLGGYFLNHPFLAAPTDHVKNDALL